MNNKPVGLHLIGGVAGLLSGILMLVSSYIVVMRPPRCCAGDTGVEVGRGDARIKRRKSHSDCADGHRVVCITQRHRNDTQLPWARFCNDVVGYGDGRASLSNSSASHLG